jgi:hypothetical protein
VKNSSHFVLLAVATSLALGACAAPPAGPVSPSGAVPVKASDAVLVAQTSFDHCPWNFGSPMTQIIRSRAAWDLLLAQSKERSGVLTQWTPRFEQQIVVVFGVGRKSSSGYSVSFVAPKQNVDNRSASPVMRLPALQKKPAPGEFQAMAVTSPCAVALLNAPANTSVDIVDAAP